MNSHKLDFTEMSTKAEELTNEIRVHKEQAEENITRQQDLEQKIEMLENQISYTEGRLKDTFAAGQMATESAEAKVADLTAELDQAALRRGSWKPLLVFCKVR